MSNNKIFFVWAEITGNVYTMSNTLYDRYMSQNSPEKQYTYNTQSCMQMLGYLFLMTIKRI